MSYLVLARKYRPTSFAEVAGQDVVTRTLRGAISEERVGHAYLFFGPRGTGKTTSARLFAKALNCEKGPTAEPCGTCERCLSYDAGTESDLIEIDAASNTGVDHVRSLRDQAAYVPLQARFKVFLIDEVHMLSKPAFNALLKTLEEPPPHVKFLLATTELHKVPETVVSRCQVLRLGPLSEEQITARLDEVFALEGVEAEPGVSSEIARRARGGMRDALSLADQLLALVGRAPAVADTTRLAGEGSTDAIEGVLDAILDADKPALLAALPSRDGDEPAFLDAMLTYLRSALLLALVGEDAPMLATSVSPRGREAMLARAGRFGADRLELVLQELLHARERMGPIHMRSHARLVLETTLLDLCRAEATMPLEELVRRLEVLETRGGAGAPAPAPARGGDRAEGAARPVASTKPKQAARPTQSAPPPKGSSSAPSSPKTAYVPPAARRSRSEGATPDGDAPPERDEIQPQPPPRPAPKRRGPSAVPRVQTNSTADRWAGFLKELHARNPEIAELVGRKGKLVRESGGVAPLKLHALTREEKAKIDDPDHRVAMSAAFAAASGDAIHLKVELHDETRRGDTDAFTREIAELFGGRIDD